MTAKKKLATFLVIILIVIVGFLYLFMKNSSERDYRGIFVEAYNKEDVL